MKRKMKEIPQNIIDLSLACFKGELSVSGQSKLEAWIGESDDNLKAFRQLREIWIALQAGSISEKYNADRAYARFRKDVMRKRSVRTSRRRAVGFACGAFAAIAAGIIALYSFHLGRTDAYDAFADIRIEAPAGSRTRVVLPDSSEVWLNSRSSISYSQGFGVENRDISMSGECHFKVSRNPEMPFTVKTDEMDIKVLGTEFNFRNYPEDDEIIVSLEKGRISMRNLLKDSHERLLFPDQKCTLDKQTGDMKIEAAKTGAISSWKTGEVFFDEEKLGEIIKKLQREFGADIEIRDSSKLEIRFYGEFAECDGIEDILGKFSSTGKITYTKTGRKYVIE